VSKSPLVTISDLEKQFGKKQLFGGLSMAIQSGDRVGLVGPNGAGKSTFLKLIAQLDTPDKGEVRPRSGSRIVYIAQSESFDKSKTPLALALEAAQAAGHNMSDSMSLAYSCLGQLGIEEPESCIKGFSGGQLKRLQIATGLCQEPDLLLLDEPTNHLDIGSILMLESLLKNSSFAWLVISHDRVFLENTVTSVAEINPAFEKGIFTTSGNYSNYKKRRDEMVQAEASRLASLKSKVRVEEAWLKQGAKARSTKSRGRTDAAHELIDKLSATKSRLRENKLKLQFTATERKTKELATFHKVCKSFGPETSIFEKLDLKLTSGSSLGVLGLNGSGKSTFVNLLSGELEPDSGNVKRASGLNIAHFRQFEGSLDQKTTLKDFLAEDSDSVVYLGDTIHVASWAQRFQFAFEQLEQPFHSLSGGERARARLAKLILLPSDILILDEPTNDLDIETLEILEESLEEYGGALVLVSHDRYLINSLCDKFLGLDGSGGAKIYADYSQWEREILRSKPENTANSDNSKREEKRKQSTSKPRKLSYMEQREFDGMEDAILELETKAEELEVKIAEAAAEGTQDTITSLCNELSEIKASIESSYQRWEELEAKIAQF